MAKLGSHRNGSIYFRVATDLIPIEMQAGTLTRARLGGLFHDHRVLQIRISVCLRRLSPAGIVIRYLIELCAEFSDHFESKN